MKIIHSPGTFKKSTKSGFTLVELAMVLVVVGLLVTLGSSLMGPMLKLAKTRETRDTVGSAMNSNMGFAAANNMLPTLAQFPGAVSKASDSWGNPLQYIFSSNLNVNLCGQSVTNLTVRECYDFACIAANRRDIQNVAFVILSAGENFNNQTAGSSAVPPGPAQIIAYRTGALPPGTNVDNYAGDFNRPESYDDIVNWVTLPELKSKIGCAGSYQGGYRVWNNTGIQRDFMIMGKCIGQLAGNSEITVSTGLTTTGQITSYNTNNGTCGGAVVNTATFVQVQTADINRDGCNDFNNAGLPADKVCP